MGLEEQGLNIVVGVKWVPNPYHVRFDEKTGALVREGVPCMVNPHDLHAVELALRVRERFGGSVTAVSMAPPSALEGLEHVIGMGVEGAVLVSDKVFARADTLATSYVLAKTVEKLGRVDLVLFGQETIDSATAHVPAQVASWLGWTYVYYVEDVEEFNSSSRTITVKRRLEDRREWYEVELPAVLSVAVYSNPPRPVSLANKLRARIVKPVYTWSNRELQLDERCVGLQGSPTVTMVSTKAPAPEKPRKRLVFKGDPREAVEWLISRLEEEGVLPF